MTDLVIDGDEGRRSSPLSPLLVTLYPKIKQAHPAEGRRQWLLRTADAFWHLSREEQVALATQATNSPLAPNPAGDDDDSLDVITNESTLGIIVRTDFSDDAAWSAFLTRLHEEEAEITRSPTAASASEGTDADAIEEDESDEESDEDEATTRRIFSVLDPTDTTSRARFTNLSNLGALRLLCDVDVRRAPERPLDVALAPSHRLISQNGWQEVYAGKGIWIYDGKSNQDQAVRVVGARGDMYGTATGDSWRARASFIPELQVNIAMGAMRVDFGGLDRWDHAERERNLREATSAPP